jgi:hypothetical protein
MVYMVFSRVYRKHDDKFLKYENLSCRKYNDQLRNTIYLKSDKKDFTLPNCIYVRKLLLLFVYREVCRLLKVG